jgi:hypothetical protein
VAVEAIETGATDALVAYWSGAARARTTDARAYLRCSCRSAATAGAKGRVLHRTFAYGALSMAAFAWD